MAQSLISHKGCIPSVHLLDQRPFISTFSFMRIQGSFNFINALWISFLMFTVTLYIIWYFQVLFFTFIFMIGSLIFIIVIILYYLLYTWRSFIKFLSCWCNCNDIIIYCTTLFNWIIFIIATFISFIMNKMVLSFVIKSTLIFLFFS